MLKTLFCALLESPKNIAFDGEDNDEKILYVFRRSMITNIDWMIVTFFLLFTPTVASIIFSFASPETQNLIPTRLTFVLNFFWYLFTLGYAFQNFINWFFNVYIITNKRIFDLDFVGFLYKNISEAPLSNIEDVTSTVSGTLRIIFNYGTVNIQTAAEQREFDFTDVPRPSMVRDIISDIIADLNS